jgi:hypothetical protein
MTHAYCGFLTPGTSLTAKLCMMIAARLSGPQLQSCQAHRRVGRVVPALPNGNTVPQHLSSVKVSCSSSSNDLPGVKQAGKLFSNLNPRTLKHEPGSVWGSALLVSGTTIGAGKHS